jgi:hypothetical protein
VVQAEPRPRSRAASISDHAAGRIDPQKPAEVAPGTSLVIRPRITGMTMYGTRWKFSRRYMADERTPSAWAARRSPSLKGALAGLFA